MTAPSNSNDRERWRAALAAKGSRTNPPVSSRAPRAGMGPNKACGHKGGICRQGSKRG